jgi:hypothetical protein
MSERTKKAVFLCLMPTIMAGVSGSIRLLPIGADQRDFWMGACLGISLAAIGLMAVIAVRGSICSWRSVR